jgi:hypothetical protein
MTDESGMRNSLGSTMGDIAYHAAREQKQQLAQLEAQVAEARAHVAAINEELRKLRELRER